MIQRTLVAVFCALAIVIASYGAQTEASSVVRELRSQYRFSAFAGSPTEQPIKRNSFIFFYTAHFETQTLDIAVACKTPGWVASGLNSDALGGMAGNGNVAVKGISSLVFEERLLNSQSAPGTPLASSPISSNQSVTVDNGYVILRYSRPFSFTETSRHTFLNSANVQTSHSFHSYDYWATNNILVATGDGMTNPPLCNSSNCNQTCVEPYYCGQPAPSGSPVNSPPPIQPETFSVLLEGSAPPNASVINAICRAVAESLRVSVADLTCELQSGLKRAIFSVLVTIRSAAAVEAFQSTGSNAALVNQINSNIQASVNSASGGTFSVSTSLVLPPVRSPWSVGPTVAVAPSNRAPISPGAAPQTNQSPSSSGPQTTSPRSGQASGAEPANVTYMGAALRIGFALATIWILG